MKAEQMAALKGILNEVAASGRAVDRAEKALNDKKVAHQANLDKLTAATTAVKNGEDIAVDEVEDEAVAE